jgi:DNA-binding transcriptional MerR regulator
MESSALPPSNRPEPSLAGHRGPQPGLERGGDKQPFPDRSLADRGRKALTIGAVCKLLLTEFPDISISKIRYLEDQKLLSPRRTQGGYRLYSQADVSRLRTILRLQRDEFLPLRVIRQELASGRADGPGPDTAEPDQRGRRVLLGRPAEEGHPLDDVVAQTGADAQLVRELEDYGLVRGEGRGGTRTYDSIEREIVRAAGELTRYGVAARNLRVFRTSADREAALLEQILGPALRSRNRERRKEAIETLESLAAVVSHLKHLLLVQDLRRLVGDW